MFSMNMIDAIAKMSKNTDFDMFCKAFDFDAYAWDFMKEEFTDKVNSYSYAKWQLFENDLGHFINTLDLGNLEKFTKMVNDYYEKKYVNKGKK